MEIDLLARILFESRHHSRRSAKRLLREATGDGSAGLLDRVLAEIERHPQRAEIEQQADSLRQAEETARWGFTRADPGGDHPEWLIAETPTMDRTFVCHLCCGGAESFVAEVFDDPSDTPGGFESWPLDEGQWLGNLLWLDGEPPDKQRRRALAKEARVHLRIYDAAADG